MSTPTRTVHVCTGCGSTTFDPERQLQFFESYGYWTCCANRQMIATATLPEKLGKQIEFKRIGTGPLIPVTLQVDHPFCWEWTGRQNRNGYGRTRWEGREPVVHRLVWSMLRQQILPSYLLLDHRCRNRLCCNPNHLEPVTNRTNTLRGEAVLFKKAEHYV